MKVLIYKELMKKSRYWAEKRNVTSVLHLAYIRGEFERCLRALLYIGVTDGAF